MKVYKCPKCNSENVFTDETGGQVGLYCGDCKRWIKWLSKNEVKLMKRQEEANNANREYN